MKDERGRWVVRVKNRYVESAERMNGMERNDGLSDVGLGLSSWMR